VDESLVQRIAAAARAMQGEDAPGTTMDKAVAVAVDIVRNADEAGISLFHLHENDVDTPAATSDCVRRIEELQYEQEQGPCIDAIFKSEVVCAPDIENDERWPGWGRQVVAETGVRSVMCFRLFTNQDTVGALNFYSRRIDAFGKEDREDGLAMAAHTSMAMAAAKEIAQVRIALDTRLVIGQAQGILMAQFDLDADRAFQVLVRASSHTNVKLRKVAENLVRTRRLPAT
jgi:transcriptional regulator with GAF, ATPase, and Fis domain